MEVSRYFQDVGGSPKQSPSIYSYENGILRFNYHPGQRRAMESKKRIVLVLSGTQGGKTTLAPWWLFREICRMGPGDYLIATPTFTLLELKALPEFRKLFIDRLHLGTYRGSPSRVFTFSQFGEKYAFGNIQREETRVLFGHAQDPESLESATVKAAVLDEAGQKKFRRDSYHAIRRRLSIYRGRVFIPTTPYTLGWLKNELHDPALDGSSDEIELIQFASIMNPTFPKEEFNEMERTLPPWKFNMFYRGIFTRPAGMIYGCFDKKKHTCRGFPVPVHWERFLGMDFGGQNTAGVYLARLPDQEKFYLYRTYHAGGISKREHVDEILKGEPGIPYSCGGQPSEDEWRIDFADAGLPIEGPSIKEVEGGIDRVYAMIKAGKIIIFDTLLDLIDEIESYSRELDDNDEPTQEIEDKEKYHLLDALRYICIFLSFGISDNPLT